MDILIRMLMAVLKDRKHKKQRRVLSTVLAAVVVFMTTYSLILPAITLEESTAETTDGIFLESADVSEADPADDDVDPSGELLLTDDAREESAPASDGWEDGLIEDADWEENGELADIPDEPALTDTGDETEEAAETETGNVYAETEEATEDTTESEESVGEGETESELEEQYPEVELSDSTQYTQVKVYAPEGAFPEGTQMLLSDVEDDETIAAICDAALAENSLVQKVHAVDISFRNSRNEEIEPLLPIRVEMTAEKCAEVGSSSVSSSVVHVDDSGNATIVENAQKVEAEAEDEKDADKLEDVETIAFEAKEFSVYALVYTVDFYWEVDGRLFEFSLPGGGYVSVEALMEALGVTEPAEEEGTEDALEDGQAAPELDLENVDVTDKTRQFVADIASVEFSDPTLVWTGYVDHDTTVGALKEENALTIEYSEELTEEQIADINAQTAAAGDWALISMQPFTTEEMLTVTMNTGEVFNIRVTDAQLKKTVLTASGETYEITVTYGEDAKIPDGAELVVTELQPGDTGFSAYCSEAAQTAVKDAEDRGIDIPVVAGVRLFDIEIHGAEGKIEPAAPVMVNIRLVKEEGTQTDLQSVIHFAQNGPEAMPLRMTSGESFSGKGGMDEFVSEVIFQTDSFSVYTVVDVSSVDPSSGGPFVLVSGIAGDPGPDVGYGENWGRDYFTKVVNGMAVMDEADLEHGLPAIGVHYWTESGQGYAGGEATEWYFESDGNGHYYIHNGQGKYLQWVSYGNNYDGLTLTTDTNARTWFNIVPTGAGDGTVYIQVAQDTNRYLHNSMYGWSNEWTSRCYRLSVPGNNGADLANGDYRFKLCKKSNEFDSFTAKKIPVTQVSTDGNYVIYHKFEDDEGNEQLYALASDGTFVRVYDGGDRIYWRETDKNIYWNYQMENGHHLISQLDGHPVYLNPMDSTGQTISTTDESLTFSGKDNGEYGTRIERWDQEAYDYAGLHVEKNGDVLTLTTGTRNAGTSDEFLFALQSEIPAGEKTPVATVDSDSLGIKITVFDYGEPEGNYNAGDKLPGMTAVAGSDAYTPHEAHALVKPYLESGLPSSTGNGAMAGLFTTNGSEVTYSQENVNHLFLQSYYDENGTFRYRSEDNYAYLGFNNDDFTVYAQVATPYTTDRQVGHPYYYHGHFMPFNDIDVRNHVSRLVDQYGTSELPLDDGRTYEDVYGITGTPNYYTGMKMEANFIQPSGGKLENGDDMVFRFTGDDDMWVYIDGILVLDIGGIHEPLSGTIDFATGKVVNPTGSSLAGTKTLYQIFMDVYNDPNTPADVKAKIAEIKWNGDTFADFTTHSFSAFYMERGAGASNLDLQFNLKIAKADEFVVRKELPEGMDDRFVNQRFKYQATYKDPNDNTVKPLHAGINQICSAVVYRDRYTENPQTHEPIPVPVEVDQDGYFYLMPGEAAVFKMGSEEIEYNVKEVTIDQNLIKQVDINDNQNVTVEEDQTVTANGKVAEAGFAQVNERSEVVYTNHPFTQNLLITKHLTDDSAPLEDGEMPVFEFRVYLEETVVDEVTGKPVIENGKLKTILKPYSYGPYYLVKDGQYYTLTGPNNAPVRQGTTPVVCSTTGRSGSINSIPPEYTIVIPDLAVGTHFYVEERRDNIPKGYEFDHEELKDDTYDPEDLYNGAATEDVIHRILARDEEDHQEFDPNTIGRIKKGKDAESHMYNRKPTVDIPVEKEWAPDDNSKPDNVSLALIRFKAPDPEEGGHDITEGNGAVVIRHFADYGEGHEALPNGFIAKYTITNKETGVEAFTNVPAGVYEVSPGSYTVTANVSNTGTVPSNYAYTETSNAEVTVLEDQSAIATLVSTYGHVENGHITIIPKASYDEGPNSVSTSLPEGYRATYTIRDNATGRNVYTNIPAGTYDVAPGTYTVSAQVSVYASPTDYRYQGTPAVNNVTVVSAQTKEVELTSSYMYSPAPPADGKISISAISSGLPGTTSLPEGFEARYSISGPDNIDNAVAGREYSVAPGIYTVTLESVSSAGNLSDEYVYVKTAPVQVEVVSADVEGAQTANAQMTVEFGRKGSIKINHIAEGLKTSSLPNDWQVQYVIARLESTGEKEVVGRDQSSNGGSYSLEPGDYRVYYYLNYYPAPNNYTYEGTSPADYVEVSLGTGENKEATITSTFERVGGNNSEVHLIVGYSPTESSEPLIVPINSTVTLKYHNYTIDHGNWREFVNPNWELHYWSGYSWTKIVDSGGSAPGDQGVDIELGDQSKYCILINTASSNESGLGASVELKTRVSNAISQQSSGTNGIARLLSKGIVNPMENSSADTNTQPITVSASSMRTLSVASLLRASEPTRGDTEPAAVTMTVRDMTAADFQTLVIPGSFVIPQTVAKEGETPEDYVLDTGFGKILQLTDPWSYTFEDLSEYDRYGNVYYYAIIEMPVPENYDVSYSVSDTSKTLPVSASDIRENMNARKEAEENDLELPALLTLQATNTRNKGNLQVTKTVKLNGSPDTVHDGEEKTFYVGMFNNATDAAAIEGTVKAIKVVAGSSTGTVLYENLPIGNRYYIFETDAEGNKLSVGGKLAGYFVNVNGGQSDPVALTPVVNVDVENEKRTGDLELTKKIAGNGADSNKAFEFTIALTAPAGETLAASYKYTKTGVDGEQTLALSRTDNDTKATITGISLKANDVYKILGLPAGTSYIITEADYSVEGYSAAVTSTDGLTGTIPETASSNASVEVTNTLSAGSLIVTKAISGNASAEGDEFSFKAVFEKTGLTGVHGSYKIGKTDELENAEATDISFAADGKAEISFTLKGGETAKFINLPEGTAFMVEELSADQNGYETSVAVEGGTITEGTKKAEGSISQTAAVTVTYTNNKVKTEKEASKVWMTKDEEIGWPENIASVEFTLYKTVNETKTEVTATDLTDYATSEQIVAFKNPAKIEKDTADQKAVWDNLPAKYLVNTTWYPAVYSVEETKVTYSDGTVVEGADAVSTAFGAVNTSDEITNVLPTIDIPVVKSWAGTETTDEDYVKITLYKGTSTDAYSQTGLINPVTLRKDINAEDGVDTDWKDSFKDLPMYDTDGTIITWKLVETEVKLGNSTLTDPARITTVYTNGGDKTVVSTATITAQTFTNTVMPASYKVKKNWGTGQQPPEGAEIKIKLKGTVPGAAPDPQPVEVTLSDYSVTDEIVLNGGAAGGSDTAAKPWEYEWNALPKYDNSGNEITYSASETSYKIGEKDFTALLNGELAPDTSMADGYLVFTNKVPTTSIKGVKDWTPETLPEGTSVDLTLKATVPGQGDNAAPVDVTTNVLPNGVTAAQTITGDGSYVWTPLPMFYTDGQEISYSISETKVTIDGKQAWSSETADTGINPYLTETTDIPATGTEPRTITFTNDFTSHSLEKEWVGVTDPAYVIQVQLKKDGAAYLDPVVIERNNEGKWEYTWNYLPKLKAVGGNAEYTAEEIGVYASAADVTDDPAANPKNLLTDFKVTTSQSEDKSRTTITNELFEVHVLKVDKTDLTKKLGGAKFVLKKENAGAYAEYVGEKTTPADGDKKGVLDYTDLPVGKYELLETHAPDGYSTLSRSIKFEIKNDGAVVPDESNDSNVVIFDGDTISFTVKNEPGAVLPMTGGSGATPYTVGGAMLMAFSTMMFLFKRRRLVPIVSGESRKGGGSLR